MEVVLKTGGVSSGRGYNIQQRDFVDCFRTGRPILLPLYRSNAEDLEWAKTAI